ncbi:MAG: hypothetical protein CVV24_08770 [Ignavibacteriae bacterium HGW-Ignavibacteriae-3]|nr:MAG: hypothetical protein CVV24_08770 [Ignavibacteriae bacterium HGW-Ignavibacteriae-3]
MNKKSSRPLLFESRWSTKFWLLPYSIETGYFVFQRSESSYNDLGKFAQDVSELIHEHVCSIVNFSNLEFIEIANGYMTIQELRRTNQLWNLMNTRRLESGNEKINRPAVNTVRKTNVINNQVYAE